MATSSPLGAVAYHETLLRHLQTREPDVWRWFDSHKFREQYAASLTSDLLKTSYRLERDAHPALYGAADEARERLGLALPMTLYQAQQAEGLNAALWFLPAELHLVLSGPVAAVLTPAEQRALFGHELTHHLLYTADGGDLFTARQILGAMADDPEAGPVHAETERRFHLFEEVVADRGSLSVSDDPLTAVSMLVKVTTGLADASAEAYLRQADEIFSRETVRTEGLSHPETFIRARALRLWGERGDAAAAEVARMIEGPLDIHAMDLVGQQALHLLTRDFVSTLLSPEWMRSEANLAHARLFFEDIEPARPDPAITATIRDADPATREYFCWILLDFACVDPSLEDKPMEAAAAVAEQFGEAKRFREMARRELGKKS